MNSKEIRDEVRQKIENISNQFDDMYCQIRNELEKETLELKVRIKEVEDQTTDTFNKITNEIAEAFIKTKLPKKLFKSFSIQSRGQHSYGHGVIYVTFSFITRGGVRVGEAFHVSATIEEMEAFIKNMPTK